MSGLFYRTVLLSFQGVHNVGYVREMYSTLPPCPTNTTLRSLLPDCNPMKLRLLSEYNPKDFGLSFLLSNPNYDVQAIQVSSATLRDVVSSLPEDCVVLNFMDNVNNFGGICGRAAIRLLMERGLPFTGSSIQNFYTKKTHMKRPGVPSPAFCTLRKPVNPTARYVTRLPFDTLKKTKSHGGKRKRTVSKQGKKTPWSPSAQPLSGMCTAPRMEWIRTVQRAIRGLKFPLLLKPVLDVGASAFITPEGCVRDFPQLLHALEKFPRLHVLIEEFIEGPEYTCFLHEVATDAPRVVHAANRALRIQADVSNRGGIPVIGGTLSVRFPKGETFHHEELKWVRHKAVRTALVRDPAVQNGISETALETWVRLGHDGYFRYDIRQREADGKYFVIDANPYCGLFYHPKEYAFSDADLILSQGGVSNHLSFTQHMIALAIRREHARRVMNGIPLVSIESNARARRSRR